MNNTVIPINYTVRTESNDNNIAGGLARVRNDADSFDWVCGDANGTIYNVLEGSTWKSKETPDLPIDYLAARYT